MDWLVELIRDRELRTEGRDIVVREEETLVRVKERGHDVIKQKAKDELFKLRFKFKIWSMKMLTENQTCQSYCSVSFHQFDLLLLNRLSSGLVRLFNCSSLHMLCSAN